MSDCAVQPEESCKAVKVAAKLSLADSDGHRIACQPRINQSAKLERSSGDIVSLQVWRRFADPKRQPHAAGEPFLEHKDMLTSD